MTASGNNNRLCNITTMWSVVFNAHEGESQVASVAQQQLLERYGGAIRRYLLKCVSDEDRADELYQDFALRFLRGDYRKVQPERGRFRDYVKVVLRRLVSQDRLKRARQPVNPVDGLEVPVNEKSVSFAEDSEFLDSWRSDLLARCWATLSREEEAGGKPYFTMLRFRGENPTMPSQEMATAFSAQLGRPVTAVSIRQLLHRARQAFAKLLVEEVAHSLIDPTDEQLEQELMVLGLFEHCRAVLEQRDGRP